MSTQELSKQQTKKSSPSKNYYPSLPLSPLLTHGVVPIDVALDIIHGPEHAPHNVHHRDFEAFPDRSKDWSGLAAAEHSPARRQIKFDDVSETRRPNQNREPRNEEIDARDFDEKFYSLPESLHHSLVLSRDEQSYRQDMDQNGSHLSDRGFKSPSKSENESFTVGSQRLSRTMEDLSHPSLYDQSRQGEDSYQQEYSLSLTDEEVRSIQEMSKHQQIEMRDKESVEEAERVWDSSKRRDRDYSVQEKSKGRGPIQEKSKDYRDRQSQNLDYRDNTLERSRDYKDQMQERNRDLGFAQKSYDQPLSRQPGRKSGDSYLRNDRTERAYMPREDHRTDLYPREPEIKPKNPVQRTRPTEIIPSSRETERRTDFYPREPEIKVRDTYANGRQPSLSHPDAYSRQTQAVDLVPRRGAEQTKASDSTSLIPPRRDTEGTQASDSASLLAPRSIAHTQMPLTHDHSPHKVDSLDRPTVPGDESLNISPVPSHKPFTVSGQMRNLFATHRDKASSAQFDESIELQPHVQNTQFERNEYSVQTPSPMPTSQARDHLTTEELIEKYTKRLHELERKDTVDAQRQRDQRIREELEAKLSGLSDSEGSFKHSTEELASPTRVRQVDALR